MVGKGSWREAREDRRGLAARSEATNERAAWWLGGQSNGRRAGWVGISSPSCVGIRLVLPLGPAAGDYGACPTRDQAGITLGEVEGYSSSCVAWRSNVYCCVRSNIRVEKIPSKGWGGLG